MARGKSRSRFRYDMRISNILKEFKQEIAKLYDQKLKDVILYGSWARGDATEKSDDEAEQILENGLKFADQVTQHLYDQEMV